MIGTVAFARGAARAQGSSRREPSHRGSPKPLRRWRSTSAMPKATARLSRWRIEPDRSRWSMRDETATAQRPRCRVSEVPRRNGSGCGLGVEAEALSITRLQGSRWHRGPAMELEPGPSRVGVAACVASSLAAPVLTPRSGRSSPFAMRRCGIRIDAQRRPRHRRRRRTLNSADHNQMNSRIFRLQVEPGQCSVDTAPGGHHRRQASDAHPVQRSNVRPTTRRSASLSRRCRSSRRTRSRRESDTDREQS